MAGKATDKVKISVAERRHKVIDLRRAGGSLRAIADQLGVSHTMVAKDLEHGLDELLKQEVAGREGLRALELDRLNSLQLAYWQRAIKGEIEAADFVLRVSARRARLLGLDKPEQLQISQTGAAGGPDWALIQQALMVALQAYPEARAAAAAGLVQLEARTTIEGEVSPTL
jgi:hypothetical protein